MQQLYTTRQRVYQVTCSQLLTDWADSQQSLLSGGRGLTVGVFLTTSTLTANLRYMMEKSRFNEQFLFVTDEDRVPSVAVHNRHWFQALLHQVTLWWAGRDQNGT